MSQESLEGLKLFSVAFLESFINISQVFKEDGNGVSRVFKGAFALRFLFGMELIAGNRAEGGLVLNIN